ncbi:hypothetical protein SDC9_149729 [bioreactor metagenome]|uniref:Uncharacterized protein n=1 Tax=bioreactor metagenome TaxID=1076179 RepID=A0A645EPQ2_9ZZZZ
MFPHKGFKRPRVESGSKGRRQDLSAAIRQDQKIGMALPKILRVAHHHQIYNPGSTGYAADPPD